MGNKLKNVFLSTAAVQLSVLTFSSLLQRHPQILDAIYASGMFNVDLCLYITSETLFG